MTSRFPTEWWKVLCTDCLNYSHSVQYYHCEMCHTSPAYRKDRLVNLKKFAIL
jgi:ribosomal protein S27E